jgi:hypothetical protein
MGEWFGLVGFWCLGYTAAAGALGVDGQAPGWRVLWGVAIGVVAVFLVVVGGAAKWAGSWGLAVPIMGVVGGALLAALVARVGKFGGKAWGWVPFATGVIFAAVVIAAGPDGYGRKAKEAVAVESGKVIDAEKPAAIEQRPVESKPAEDMAAGQVEKASCDCAAGAVCTGPRGGQYCLDADGKKRYRTAQ